MRALFAVGIVAVFALGLTGCGNQKKGEELAQQMIDEMNKMSDALEKGDMATAKAGLTKLNELAKAAKDVKVTKSQDKAIEDKYKGQLQAAQERMQKALMAAATSGKVTPQELMAFGEEASKMGK
jgi:Tfp pilus assembly protein PilF